MRNAILVAHCVILMIAYSVRKIIMVMTVAHMPTMEQTVKRDVLTIALCAIPTLRVKNVNMVTMDPRVQTHALVAVL